MSELSGSLDDFPLPDVMRLLARGDKHGVLHVYGDVVRGRVYLDEGKISYATTRSTDDFAEGSGAESRDSQDRRKLKLEEVGDDDPELFTDYLKLQITEVLVRLGRESSGSFVFQNGVVPQEPVKEPFLVDDILASAEAELKEWHRIEAIIGTTSQPMTIVLPVEEHRSITLTGVEWNTLGVLAGVATTREVAETLEIFEIVAGRIIARMVEDGLVEIATDPRAARQEAYQPEEPILAESYRDEEELVELSESESRDLLSALTQKEDDSDGDGFEGLEDDRTIDVAVGEDDDDDDEEPASDLARRWRNLRANAAEQ